jgi:8-amino-7-oxononanoate synthase
VLDFTSALYLGLRHASASLRPWAQLTAGVPAALATPALARTVAGRLASLAGTERVTLARSTLHTFWDLFVILARSDTTIYVDASAYPIARWGAERAASRGVPVRTFAHHDPADLWRRLTREPGARRRPLVVVDGVCPGCGAFAPLREYLERAREFGGSLVVDDTQALGIVGHSPGPRAPYGSGGGGSLRRHGVGPAHVVLVSSLAKGFGVPMAMLGGSAAAVARFEAESATRVHCSPPSFAELHAAERALDVNRASGDALRRRLARLVRRFRAGLRAFDISVGRSLFAVQSLASSPVPDARALHRRLLELGVRTVLQRSACGSGLTVSFLITAGHSPAAIDRAVEAVAASAGALVAGDRR